MKAKQKYVSFKSLKIGERFKDGSIIWTKTERAAAKAEGAVAHYYNLDCTVERVK